MYQFDFIIPLTGFFLHSLRYLKLKTTIQNTFLLKIVWIRGSLKHFLVNCDVLVAVHLLKECKKWTEILQL